MIELHKDLANLKLMILNTGFEINDNRLGRIVTVECVSYTSRDIILTELSKETILPKYDNDWNRMKQSFSTAVEELKKYPTSRRAVVLNTNNYNKIYPCFVSIQFLYSPVKQSYGAIVSQRSLSIDKFQDDLIFFSYLMRKMEESLKKKVNWLIVNIGSLHCILNPSIAQIKENTNEKSKNNKYLVSRK